MSDPLVDEARAAGPRSFAELADSRKAWIAEVLQPWCRQASRSDLRLAELEWGDIAGKVDAGKTLWAWAWSRFPAAVHAELGLDETTPLAVTLKQGQIACGYVDARASTAGQLVLLGRPDPDQPLSTLGPFNIDDIATIERLSFDDPRSVC
jgi:hypothetical protein